MTTLIRQVAPTALIPVLEQQFIDLHQRLFPHEETNLEKGKKNKTGIFESCHSILSYTSIPRKAIERLRSLGNLCSKNPDDNRIKQQSFPFSHLNDFENVVDEIRFRAYRFEADEDLRYV
ncbi:hypothetical protein TNCV_2516211 [Trichonephila clavipes]|nr:hypothetical protein TNCV_2516211 [Trichonephila clavipes]